MKKVVLFLLISAMLLTSLLGCNFRKENPPSDFEYSIDEDGGVRITKYVGDGLHVVIPEQIEGRNVVKIDDNAFYNSSIKTLVMPDTVKWIGLSAFYSCVSLEKVQFSKNLISVNSKAFANCISLREADLSADTMQFIGIEAFANCIELRTVKFGKNITEIQELAFKFCGALKKIILPENLQKIGQYAFRDCFSATEIFIPKTLEEWGWLAFESTVSVTKITFEDGLRRIGFYGGFTKCQVKEVTIPSSVERIGDLAFAEIPYLEKVYFEGNAPRVGDDVFAGMGQKITCYYDPATEGWDTTSLRDKYEVKAK